MNRRGILISLLIFLSLTSSAAPSKIKGTVMDEAGKPFAGAVVSDGFSCVRVDAKGRFTLERNTEARYVSCSLPADARIPVVSGHPVLYKELTPSVSGYNFVFKRAPRTQEVKFLCIGDPQVSEQNNGLERFATETAPDVRDFASRWSGSEVIAIGLGDFVHNEWRSFQRMYSLLTDESLGVPCFCVIGNHDHKHYSSDCQARESYEKIFGPTNYSFNRAGVHVAVIDGLYPQNGRIADFVSDEVKEWLRQDLALADTTKALMLVVHDAFGPASYPEIYDMMSRFREARLVAGHSHSIRHRIHKINGKEIYEDVVGTSDGVDWAGTLCGDGAPMGYAYFSFTGAHCGDSYYKAVGYKPDYQIRMYHSSDFPAFSRVLIHNKTITFDWDRTPGTVIFNVWNWNPKWKLTLLEDRKISDAKIVADNTMYDMFACTYFYKYKNRWTGSYCQRRNHLFKVVPNNPDAKLEIRAEDEYGNVFTQDAFTTTIDRAGTYSGTLPDKAKKHPYLLVSEDDIARIRKGIQQPGSPVEMMHSLVMSIADESLTAPALVYKKDESGKRLLHVSRRAMLQITSCAYAWRFGGDKKYLDRAVSDLESVCAFPDWNPSHYLDVAEMAAAVGVGYDWLYDALPSALRTTIETVVPEYVFKTSLAPQRYFDMVNNWNQVCVGGTLIAAMALCHPDDPWLLSYLDKSIVSNRKVMPQIYGPDGVYPEGPIYWAYGTSYEVLLIQALNDFFGTDYALYEQKGFTKSADFIRFSSYGAIGECYNFYDNIAKEKVYVPLWYFAARDHRPELLDYEIRLLRAHDYRNRETERFLPLVMGIASRIDFSERSDAAGKVFFGRGKNPVYMLHTDWTYSPTDKFLGVKGGKAGQSHGHMDAGSFVYDAYGCRWCMDISRQEYAPLEVAFKKVGGSMWSNKQDAGRWDILRYNNLFHNTLTINGADHRVDGMAEIVKALSDGAVLNLSPVFEGEAASVRRTVRLVDEKYLEVKDEVTALEGKDAEVHWNIATPAAVEVASDCIRLTQSGKTLVLKTSSDAHKVKYASWTTDPKAYGRSVAQYEKPLEGVSLCGFEAVVPAGKTAVFVTKIK